MGNIAAFGKKRSIAAARVATAPKTAEPVAEPHPQPAEEFVPEIAAQFAAPSRVPYLTFGLIAILMLVFRTEKIPALDLSQLLVPNTQWLLAAGGLSGSAVFGNGEWWRVFTAPVLHDGFLDLLSNIVALLIAGWIFERLIGRAWFAALFVTSALGGSIGCLVLNAPATVSAGASGGVMGLLAATFVCSFIFESAQLRKRMQRGSLRLLVPSLLPAVLPLLDGSISDSDYGAPIGGAVAGVLMGLALRALWPEETLRPQGSHLALIIAAAGGLLSACGFVFIAMR